MHGHRLWAMHCDSGFRLPFACHWVEPNLCSRCFNEKGSWFDARLVLPDADITVLIVCPDESDPVWMGYYDGTKWFAIDGSVEVMVSHWRPLLAAPDPEPHRQRRRQKRKVG